MKYILLVSTAILLLFSCKKEDNADALTWQYGKNDYQEEIDDTTRIFTVHVPASYNKNDKSPIVFMLHGSSGDGNKFYNISRWVEKSEEENFIAVFPTALAYPVNENGNKSTKWSTPSLPDELTEAYPIKDDVLFFDEMVNLLKKTFNVDEKRIYLCGFSNGGNFIRNVLIPRRSNQYAAFSINGGFGVAEKLILDQERFPPLYAIIGSKDDRIIENTGELEEFPFQGEQIMDHPLYGQYVRGMLNTLEIGENFTEKPNPPSYNILTFADDLSGDGNEYKLMVINELQHNFANGSNNKHEIVAVDFIWPWFKKYSL